MTAAGHSRPIDWLAMRAEMSALAPKATVCRQAENLSLSARSRHMQRSKLRSIHLGGALLEEPRHVEAERFGGLEVDDQIEFGQHLRD
jgi:hypothetical protein